MKRARVPGRANDDVENMIGITPELFTCLSEDLDDYEDNKLIKFHLDKIVELLDSFILNKRQTMN